MNFLAHLFLSGNEPDIIIGNFIADSVRKSTISNFSEGIKNGVVLHRLIDEFTDQHPIVNKSKERLRPMYRKYASVIVDIYYDHFLAKNWSHYSRTTLESFATKTYAVLDSKYAQFPLRPKQFYRYMVSRDILVAYAELEGMQQVFLGMSHRASFNSKMETAVRALEQDYKQYEKEFSLFFPQLQIEAQRFLASLETE